MKVKKISTDRSKEIIVVDDFFSVSDQQTLFHFASNSHFTFNNFDIPGDTNLKWRCNLRPEDQNYLLKLPEKITDLLKKIIDQDIVFEIEHSYINFADYSTVDKIHCDSFNEFQTRDLTILIYGNHQWHHDWGGETKFYNNDLSEIIYSSIIRPGRILIFDGEIPHTASAPNRSAEFQRYTYAFKIKSFIEKKEQ